MKKRLLVYLIFLICLTACNDAENLSIEQVPIEGGLNYGISFNELQTNYALNTVIEISDHKEGYITNISNEKIYSGEIAEVGLTFSKFATGDFNQKLTGYWITYKDNNDIEKILEAISKQYGDYSVRDLDTQKYYYWEYGNINDFTEEEIFQLKELSRNSYENISPEDSEEAIELYYKGLKTNNFPLVSCSLYIPIDSISENPIKLNVNGQFLAMKYIVSNE